MPLTRKQFELGIDRQIEESMSRIYSYLSLHKEEAFTEEELAAGLGVKEPSKPMSGDFNALNSYRKAYEEYGERLRLLNKALGKLIEIGVVESAEVRASIYYAVGSRPLELFLEPKV